jgi:hypothetical protein
VDGGTEILLYDPRRQPANWPELMEPTGCAVILKDRATSTPVTANGLPVADAAFATCVVFPSFDSAMRFCEAQVGTMPDLRCEIYDHEGLARPPLAVVPPQDSGERGSRRKWFSILVGLIAAALFWLAARADTSRDIAIFVAINCIVLVLRFLYWDAALSYRERQRLARVVAHRKREREGMR